MKRTNAEASEELFPRTEVGAKRVWIDLDNSPHVPFFVPIIEELEQRGYTLLVTLRDAYQTKELAQFFGLTCSCVGSHYGRRKLLKVLGTFFRAIQLVAVVAKQRPNLAVAHGSRAQLLVSTFLRIPSISIEDYEYGANLAVIQPTWLMVPKVLADSAGGGYRGHVLTYPGIKEDVYAPRFMPDPSIKTELGLDENDLVVTVRPPASEAHYHRPASDRLFAGAMEFLGRASGVKIVVVPRNARQVTSVRASWQDLFESGKAIIPQHAVDGLNLIWHSDLVISGGGTMNREAAALGVPVYSIFRGQIGAVDRHLANEGRLVLLESIDDFRTKVVLRRRAKISPPERASTAALATVVNHITSLLTGIPTLK